MFVGSKPDISLASHILGYLYVFIRFCFVACDGRKPFEGSGNLGCKEGYRGASAVAYPLRCNRSARHWRMACFREANGRKECDGIDIVCCGKGSGRWDAAGLDEVVTEFARESQGNPTTFAGSSSEHRLLLLQELFLIIYSAASACNCRPLTSTMASLCTRCALRLRRATENANGIPLTRSFTTTQRPRNKALPSFQPTSNPELDALFKDFRYKHFLPATLDNQQHKLVFKWRNKNVLQENPQTVNIGGEEFQLEYLGGRGGMPNRKKQLQHVLRLLKDADPNDWNNLPALLRGLHMMGKDPSPRVRARIVRLATERGKFGVVLSCLNSANKHWPYTQGSRSAGGGYLGLRQVAQNGEWSEEATAKALKDANEVASQLESDAHGMGKHVGKDDPRRNPYVLGIFLELAAVYAQRFKGGKDVDGKVRAFTDRLLSNISEEQKVVCINRAFAPGLELTKSQIHEEILAGGPITPMRHYAPILHGLKLAERILGDSMPQKVKAKEVMENYERTLDQMWRTLEERDEADKARTQPNQFRAEALRVWRSVFADD